MGRSPKGNAPAASRAKVEAFWREIEVVHRDIYRLHLRDAANLVGFGLYPVGWTWTEYGQVPGDEVLDYAEKAATFRFLDVGKPDKEPAVEALAAANAFRKAEAGRVFWRMVRHEGLKVFLLDDDARWRRMSGKLRGSEFAQLDISKSMISDTGLEWDCRVDAEDLIHRVKDLRANTGRAPAFDWLRLERHARNRFESQPFPTTNEDVLSATSEWYAKVVDADTQPTVSTFRALLAELRTEYVDSENEI